MQPRKKKRSLWLVLLGLFFTGLCFFAYQLYDQGRPAPVPHEEKLFGGAATYYRRVKYIPRMRIAHVMVIDTKTNGLELLVTPPDFDSGDPLAARTTSEFLAQFEVQIAINGDGFTPWWSRSPLDYYPHSGDPVTPNGLTASRGNTYAWGILGTEPTLYISRRNGLSFREPGRVYQAISGDRFLVLGGEPAADLDTQQREPRTAIGFNKNGRWLILVVVDGRQPFYSEGATFAELADILIDHGAHFGLALDGGGSSTMVIQGPDGAPRVLNSPIDSYIPGRERPVANHLGVYFR